MLPHPIWNPPVDPPPSSPLHVCHRFAHFDHSDVYAAVQRITFVDKVTLGQSAVLGIMCVNLPSSRILSPLDRHRHQQVEPPFSKPVQLARDGFFPLVPPFHLPPKLGSPKVADREMDEVRQELDGWFNADRHSSINIFLWAIALLCHAACKSFGGLFAARFVLGICEGAITPGFMIVCTISPHIPRLTTKVHRTR